MVQLNRVEISTIDSVVQSVRNNTHRRILAAKRRNASEAEQIAHRMRKYELHQKRLAEIMAVVGEGYLTLVKALRTPKLQELFATIPYFALYECGDEYTVVSVGVEGESLYLSITGSRPSSTQNADHNAARRFMNCEVSRRYKIAEENYPESFFQLVFMEDFDHAWFDWVFADEGYTDENAPILNGVGGNEIKQFFSFNSRSIFDKTAKVMKENARDLEAGHHVNRAWVEIGIYPGHVLTRFFYDCTDLRLLQHHISEALKNLNV